MVHYSIQWSSVAEMSEYDDVISPAAGIMRWAKANLTVILKSSVTASLPISLHFHKLKAAPFCPAHQTAVVHRVETQCNLTFDLADAGGSDTAVKESAACASLSEKQRTWTGDSHWLQRKASGQRQLPSAPSPSAKLHEETPVALNNHSDNFLPFQSGFAKFDLLIQNHKLRKVLLTGLNRLVSV